MKIKQLFYLLSYSLGGIIATMILNYAVLHRIIIPDECYYHNKGTTAIFDVFYTLPAYNGYHPFPTLFNLLLTMAAGITGGVLTYRLLHREHGQIAYLNGNFRHKKISIN